MNVLIIYTNTYRMLAPAPLGASLVAARLRRAGHRVQLLDLMFSRRPSRAAAEAVRDFRPDLIAFSIRNVDNQSSLYPYDPLPGLESIVAAARAVSPAPALLGGTAFTTFPVQYLARLGAEYGICGDDLEPIVRFVDSLAAGAPDWETPGLVYRAGGAVHRNPFTLRGYAGVGFEGWDLLDVRRYRQAPTVMWDVGLVARTGCPFHCVFCDTFRTFGNQWVLRDPQQVAEEAGQVARLGARRVFLADAGFNRPLGHAKAVLEALIRAGVRLRLTMIFEPGEMDAEFAALFRRAGGMDAMVFAGSLVDEVLAAGRKPFRVEDVLRGSQILKQAGVLTALFLTFGGPGETMATAARTYAVAGALQPAYSMVDYGLRIQPGTALQRMAVAEGLLAPDDDCFRPVTYCSPATPVEKLRPLVKGYEAGLARRSWRALPWMAGLIWDKYRP
ncbi:MAG TPA: B12-binding domain-containing radical SAM protein [Anaerolineae bacterium]